MGDLQGDHTNRLASQERTPPDDPAPPRRGISRRRALVVLAGLAAAGGAGAYLASTTAPVRESSAPATPGNGLAMQSTGAQGAAASTSTAPNAFAVPALPNPALPDRAVSMWINTFELPTVRDLPPDVVETVNMVIFAIAQSAEAGTGTLRWEPGYQSYDEIAADVAGLVSRDKPVLLGIGGASDGGITLVDEQNVQQFCDSIRFFVATFGFTGIDLDLEPSGSSWSEESLVAVVRTLKSEFGADFLVGLTVGLYGEYTARWLALAQALGKNYDYWAPMLYDYPEAHDERLIPDALKKIQTAVDGGVPTSKQILGFMCNAYYNTSPVGVTAAVWKASIAKYPDLRGAFIWESKLELASDFEWTRNVGAKLISAP